MNIKYVEVGACGLSCRLCPWHHSKGESKCEGCKSKFRMTAGCPFITCAVKKKGIEFCGYCIENENCEKWRKHRDAGRQHDSFTCYQKLEENIAFILKNSLGEFDRLQKLREGFLKEMLQEFNEGRSKTYYCIASAVLEMDELEAALKLARESSQGQDMKGKSRVLHAVLDDIAEKKQYRLKLRK